MDWFPLYNSVRIALLATALSFFIGICLAWICIRLSPAWKAIADCIFTLPLILPPTVLGFFLMELLRPEGLVGLLLQNLLGIQLTMTWPASVLAAVIVTFPLMYRTARGSFEAFDEDLLSAGRTLGHSDLWLFWRVVLPGCRQSLLAGIVLVFARGLGEYGATSMVSGYIPGQTATISTTVYQLWKDGNDLLAYQWVTVNVLISLLILLIIHLVEQKQKENANNR